MDVPLRPQEPADLEAGIGARNVIEACAIKAADFHVFYWLGLDRKISCLPSRNRNQTGRGAEEEAFHHLHLEPPIVVLGRVPSMAGWIAPLKAPSSPNPPGPFTPRKTPDESTWGSPLCRTVTLTDGVRRATKKCPAHTPLGTISGRCCVKNTQPALPSP